MDASAREKASGAHESTGSSALDSLVDAVKSGTEAALGTLKEILESMKNLAPEFSSLLAFLGGDEKKGSSETSKKSPSTGIDAKNQPSAASSVTPSVPVEQTLPKKGDIPSTKEEPKTSPHLPKSTAGKTREEKREEDMQRYAEIGKMPSIEALRSIPDPGRRVAAVAEELMKLDVRGKHCWDWVDVIYYSSGVKRRGVFSSFRDYEGRDCGKHHADKALVDALEPGDHIFINNKNKTDKHGNHSGIFMGWVDKTQGIAKLAQLPAGSKRAPKVMVKNIRYEAPVTFIAKPMNG